MNTAFITHGDCQLHDMGAMHPECPQRLPAVQDQLIASGISDHLDHIEAPLVTRDRNATARRILAGVKKIAGIGMRTFVQDPTVYANFESLITKAAT